MKIKKTINAPHSGFLLADGLTLDALLNQLIRLFDYSDDCVVLVDQDNHAIYLNRKALRRVKLTEHQVTGQLCHEIFSEDKAMHLYLESLQEVIAKSQSTSFSKVTNVAKSDYDIVSIYPITDLPSLCLGLMIVTRVAIDTSTLVDEVNLKDIYQKVMMDSIPFMIWLKDKDSRLLAANIAYAEMAGYSDPNELKGKTDFDFWPHHLAQHYFEDDKKVLESGEPVTLAEKIKKKNGDVSWAETYKAPVIVDGNVIGTVGYARDITEEKQLLSTISKKDLQFNSILQSLPLSIIRYDLNCKRTFINAIHNDEEIMSLLGKTPEEKWSSNILNMTAADFQERLMHVLYHGETQTFELHCNVNNERFVNMNTLLPEFDEHHQVTGALAISNDVTEISKYRDDLEFMAYHDALTSLPNRTLLNQKLHSAAKDGVSFGLLFMDLDFFKEINDTLGHIVGDVLLVDAAKRISASVRIDDFVARIGGDEFAILVTDLRDEADLATLAEKISQNLSKPFLIDQISFFVTASIGIACYPIDSENVEDLIKYADTAMYDAKKKGRNNYQFYTPELTQDAMEHLAIATALRYAIQKNELLLLFQPKVEIATGKIIGAESLLRWNGKVLGQISPDKFIPIAEESRLIIEIGAWVLRSAFEVAVQINQTRQVPLNIAVNVSSKEFVGNDFINNLQRCLKETSCKPSWITLEITESLLLHDSDKALETLIKIDEMGIILSIDDFGTGYSALAYLSKFPIRQVKIDRSFVMDICDSQNAASLVKAIIAMTLSLNKELVAEGIETKEQAELIQQYGCHQAQGYFYSKPIPFIDFLRLVSVQANA